MRLLVTCLATLAAACGFIAAEAGADVQNGDFDEGTCVALGCTGPGWSQGEAAYGSGADAIGPICNGVVPDCGSFGSGYTSVPNWARIAAGIGTLGQVKAVYSSVSQTVSIPAAPATLRFVLRIVEASPQFNDGYLTVRLGDRTVFFATSYEPGYTNYTPVVVDVSAFAGQSPALTFSGTSSFTGTHSYSFDIDAVSISQGQAPPVPVQPVAATGQRAAALAKCKKKKSKKARKKCRKRALLLPV